MIIYNFTNISNLEGTIPAVDGSMDNFFPEISTGRRYVNFDRGYIEAYADTWPEGATVQIDAEHDNSPKGVANGAADWSVWDKPSTAQQYRWKLLQWSQQRRPDCNIGFYRTTNDFRSLADDEVRNGYHPNLYMHNEYMQYVARLQWIGRQADINFGFGYWRDLGNQLDNHSMRVYQRDMEMQQAASVTYFGRYDLCMLIKPATSGTWGQPMPETTLFMLQTLAALGMEAGIWLGDDIKDIDQNTRDYIAYAGTDL